MESVCRLTPTVGSNPTLSAIESMYGPETPLTHLQFKHTESITSENKSGSLCYRTAENYADATKWLPRRVMTRVRIIRNIATDFC